ncbi:MAG: hypothetical protein NVSMB32_17270 [Actinomycetota bacterium]
MRKVRTSLKTLGPKVSATRMLREYVEWAYQPAAARADTLAEDKYARAKALAAWKQRVREGWSAVELEGAGEETVQPELGKPEKVVVQVHLGPLTPDDVSVQLVHGPLDMNDDLQAELIEPMAHSSQLPQGTWCYEGSFTCERPGRYGFALRVVPNHPDLITFAEVGRITWATTRGPRACD